MSIQNEVSNLNMDTGLVNKTTEKALCIKGLCILIFFVKSFLMVLIGPTNNLVKIKKIKLPPIFKKMVFPPQHILWIKNPQFFLLIIIYCTFVWYLFKKKLSAFYKNSITCNSYLFFVCVC